MKTRTKVIFAILAGLVLLVGLNIKVTHSLSKNFSMNAHALRDLVDLAHRNDPTGEAALELSHFYRFELHDAKAGIMWEAEAAKKGNATALHNQKVQQEDSELRDRP